MKTFTECSSTIPSATDFGASGTDVNMAVELVLQPRVLHARAAIAHGMKDERGTDTTEADTVFSEFTLMRNLVVSVVLHPNL